MTMDDVRDYEKNMHEQTNIKVCNQPGMSWGHHIPALHLGTSAKGSVKCPGSGLQPHTQAETFVLREPKQTRWRLSQVEPVWPYSGQFHGVVSSRVPCYRPVGKFPNITVGKCTVGKMSSNIAFPPTGQVLISIWLLLLIMCQGWCLWCKRSSTGVVTAPALRPCWLPVSLVTSLSSVTLAKRLNPSEP